MVLLNQYLSNKNKLTANYINSKLQLRIKYFGHMQVNAIPFDFHCINKIFH